MIKPKYNPIESLNRMKLLMKYDSNKTLTENVHILLENDGYTYKPVGNNTKPAYSFDFEKELENLAKERSEKVKFVFGVYDEYDRNGNLIRQNVERPNGHKFIPLRTKKSNRNQNTGGGTVGGTGGGTVGGTGGGTVGGKGKWYEPGPKTIKGIKKGAGIGGGIGATWWFGTEAFGSLSDITTAKNIMSMCDANPTIPEVVEDSFGDDAKKAILDAQKQIQGIDFTKAAGLLSSAFSGLKGVGTDLTDLDDAYDILEKGTWGDFCKTRSTFKTLNKGESLEDALDPVASGFGITFVPELNASEITKFNGILLNIFNKTLVFPFNPKESGSWNFWIEKFPCVANQDGFPNLGDVNQIFVDNINQAIVRVRLSKKGVIWNGFINSKGELLRPASNLVDRQGRPSLITNAKSANATVRCVNDRDMDPSGFSNMIMSSTLKRHDILNEQPEIPDPPKRGKVPPKKTEKKLKFCETEDSKGLETYRTDCVKKIVKCCNSKIIGEIRDCHKDMGDIGTGNKWDSSFQSFLDLNYPQFKDGFTPDDKKTFCPPPPEPEKPEREFGKWGRGIEENRILSLHKQAIQEQFKKKIVLTEQTAEVVKAKLNNIITYCYLDLKPGTIAIIQELKKTSGKGTPAEELGVLYQDINDTFYFIQYDNRKSRINKGKLEFEETFTCQERGESSEVSMRSKEVENLKKDGYATAEELVQSGKTNPEKFSIKDREKYYDIRQVGQIKLYKQKYGTQKKTGSETTPGSSYETQPTFDTIQNEQVKKLLQQLYSYGAVLDADRDLSVKYHEFKIISPGVYPDIPDGLSVFLPKGSNSYNNVVTGIDEALKTGWGTFLKDLEKCPNIIKTYHRSFTSAGGRPDLPPELYAAKEQAQACVFQMKPNFLRRLTGTGVIKTIKKLVGMGDESDPGVVKKLSPWRLNKPLHYVLKEQNETRIKN